MPSLWKSPCRIVALRAELGENLSAVGLCECVCVWGGSLCYYISFHMEVTPLCVNKEHEDETELCASHPALIMPWLPSTPLFSSLRERFNLCFFMSPGAGLLTCSVHGWFREKGNLFLHARLLRQGLPNHATEPKLRDVFAWWRSLQIYKRGLQFYRQLWHHNLFQNLQWVASCPVTQCQPKSVPSSATVSFLVENRFLFHIWEERFLRFDLWKLFGISEQETNIYFRILKTME